MGVPDESQGTQGTGAGGLGLIVVTKACCNVSCDPRLVPAAARYELDCEFQSSANLAASGKVEASCATVGKLTLKPRVKCCAGGGGACAACCSLRPDAGELDVMR